MVVAGQMQQPVDKEPLRFLVKGYAVLFCLEQSCRHAYDNIAEREWGVTPLSANRRKPAVRQRKGQYISGPVDTPVMGVEAFHSFAVHEYDAEFSSRKT